MEADNERGVELGLGMIAPLSAHHHGAWTSAPLSAHLPTECKCTSLQIETPFVPAAQQIISLSDNNSRMRATHWADYQWNAEWADNMTPYFHLRHR